MNKRQRKKNATNYFSLIGMKILYSCFVSILQREYLMKETKEEKRKLVRNRYSKIIYKELKRIILEQRLNIKIEERAKQLQR